MVIYNEKKSTRLETSRSFDVIFVVFISFLYTMDTNTDCRILCYLAAAVCKKSEMTGAAFGAIFEEFGSVMGPLEPGVHSNVWNVVGVLMCYWSPMDVRMAEMVAVIRAMDRARVDGFGAKVDLDLVRLYLELDPGYRRAIEFADSISNIVDPQRVFDDESVAKNTANEIVQDVTLQCRKLGVSLVELPRDEMVFQFVAKRLELCSMYMDDVKLPQDVVMSLEHYEPFFHWYKGIYCPYQYYYDNYSRLGDSMGNVLLAELMAMESTEDIFQVLATPIGETSKYSKILTEQWMKQVILPVLKWKNHDFRPLSQWLFDQKRFNVSTVGYSNKLWKSCLKALTEAEIPFDFYLEIVEKYIAGCYYEWLALDNQVSSLETLSSYDVIKECCLVMIPVAPAKDTVKEKDIQCSEQEVGSFEEFLLKSSLSPLFKANKDCLITLSETIDTCLKLYPINKLTVADFLRLKYDSEVDPEEKTRQVSKILVGLTTDNSKQLLASIELFNNVFVNEADDIETHNNVIVDRFLINNLFDAVSELYVDKKLGISSSSYYQLVLKKFWDCFKLANNFDDRVGKLKQASQCISLFNQMSETLTSEQKSDIIRLKHLMKVMTSIKNFKVVIERGVPTTPAQVIRTFGVIPSTEEAMEMEMESQSPMGLITTILEQNPKSYIAFEKLFKILNEFLLFLHHESDDNSYYFQRLMSACIESSLIDNNFNYAYNKSLQLLTDYTSQSPTSNLNSMWLTFYQVGRYMSPEWYNEEGTLSPNQIEVLLKQSQVLSKYLLVIKRTESSLDNSRIIVNQWENVNEKLEMWYEKIEAIQKQPGSESRQLQQNITDSAQEIINDATNSTNQASEKLSNLFISGLGWAIGANP